MRQLMVMVTHPTSASSFPTTSSTAGWTQQVGRLSQKQITSGTLLSPRAWTGLFEPFWRIALSLQTFSRAYRCSHHSTQFLQPAIIGSLYGSVVDTWWSTNRHFHREANTSVLHHYKKIAGSPNVASYAVFNPLPTDLKHIIHGDEDLQSIKDNWIAWE